jgi:hypothetical protein
LLRLPRGSSLKTPVCRLPCTQAAAAFPALFRGFASQAPGAIYGSSPSEGLRQILMNCPNGFSCDTSWAHALSPDRQKM